MALEIIRLASDVAWSAQQVWDWHSRPGALQRLLPPWEPISVVEQKGGLEEGSRTTLRLKYGFLEMDWVSEHLAPDPGRSFGEMQVQGPFATWRHRHLFSASSDSSCEMEDRIDYELPAEPFGTLVAGRRLRERIERGLAYRHRVVARDLNRHGLSGLRPSARVGITGASGLVGSALTHVLATGGHRPRALPRPSAAAQELKSLENLDAIVHLAGEPIAGGSWSPSRKRRIRDSRVEGTRGLAESLRLLRTPPDVLICASAIGFYGDRGAEVVDEESGPGSGFLPGVAEEWEQAAEVAREAGVRVVQLRFGIILWPGAGALSRLLGPMRAGVGGHLGTGRQFWSWVSLDDAVGSILHAMTTDELSGPVNVTSPVSVQNREFTRVLSEVLDRPALLPVPAPVLRAALGSMADELLLAGARVTPRRLMETGYEFGDGDLEAALRHMLGRY
jgi:uncharacterized protein (TIGR01777 family)